MRKEFSDAIEKLSVDNEKIIFITGDLGYNALENLKAKMGERFINAGVAEQNMVGMAAGLAYKGYKVFCYSIAPFIVYRCLEQYRNDVCLHNLPVFLVGNGGGYGYGIMGSTHHALEDIACMSVMQNSKCWVPAFTDEVEIIVSKIIKESGPAYLRLNTGKKSPQGYKPSSSINIIVKSPGANATIISCGPIVNNVMAALQKEHLHGKFNVYTAITFPLEISDELATSIAETKNVLVVEEHVSIGGLAQQLSVKLLEHNIKVGHFTSLCAKGYPGKLYGDQNYHQVQSGLDAENIAKVLSQFIS